MLIKRLSFTFLLAILSWNNQYVVRNSKPGGLILAMASLVNFAVLSKSLQSESPIAELIKAMRDDKDAESRGVESSKG